MDDAHETKASLLRQRSLLKAEIEALRADAERLRETLTELRDRIKRHPAYENLTEEEEIATGGDTAELSYLARVADASLAAKDAP